MLDLKKRIMNTAYLPAVMSCVIAGFEAQATDPLADLQNQLAVSNQQFVTLDQVTTNLKKKMTKQLQTIQEQEGEIAQFQRQLAESEKIHARMKVFEHERQETLSKLQGIATALGIDATEKSVPELVGTIGQKIIVMQRTIIELDRSVGDIWEIFRKLSE